MEYNIFRPEWRSLGSAQRACKSLVVPETIEINLDLKKASGGRGEMHGRERRMGGKGEDDRAWSVQIGSSIPNQL